MSEEHGLGGEGREWFFQGHRALSDQHWERESSEVRESKRLTDSPCCLVNVEGGLSTQTQRLLKMANKDFTESARILEINPSAALIRRLCNLSANDQHHDFIKRCGLQLWSNAMMLDGVMAEPRGTGRADTGIHDGSRGEAVAADSLTGRAVTEVTARSLLLGASKSGRIRGCWSGSASVPPVEEYGIGIRARAGGRWGRGRRLGT